jgi:OmcA/MtrC family decaheme c-type cytochrome
MILRRPPVSGCRSPQPLQITYDFVPNGDPITVTREIVTTAACAECHGTRNGIAHGTRYNADWCVVCHTAETKRNGETVEFKSMVHAIHTSQTRSFLDASEITYPQDITNCIKCHKGGTESDNWMNQPSIEACGSCHTGVNFATGAGHVGGIRTNDECAGCHDAAYVETKHLTVNASPNNPNVPAGDVNFAYEINLVTASSTTTLSAVNPIIKFRILADENATPVTPVTFATYTTGATMLSVGTHTFSGSPSFLVAYALPQEGLTNNAATMNDYNNLGKAAAQPASISITNLWNGTAGTLTGPAAGGWYTATITSSSGKFPAGAKMRSVALQGYFTQVDTATARHTISVTGTVTGDTVRRVVVDPAKCANCHEWFEGHGGNRVYETQVCVMCHNPNLSSSGRGADPATVLSRMSTENQAAMTAAGYDPANPSTYPEASQNFKDLIHATHASGSSVTAVRVVCSTMT